MSGSGKQSGELGPGTGKSSMVAMSEPDHGEFAMQEVSAYLGRSKGKSHGGDEDGGTHFGGGSGSVCFSGGGG